MSLIYQFESKVPDLEHHPEVTKRLRPSTETGKQALASLFREQRNNRSLTISNVLTQLTEKKFQSTWSAIQELEKPRLGQRLDWELIRAILVYLDYPRDLKGNKYTIKRLMLLAAELEDDDYIEPELQSHCNIDISQRSTPTGKKRLTILFKEGRKRHSLQFVRTQLQQQGFETSHYSLEVLLYNLYKSSKIDWELVNALAELGFFPYTTEELMLIAFEVTES